MRRSKHYKVYLALAIMSAVAFIALFILGVLPVVFNNVYGDPTRILQLLFLVFAIPFAVGATFSVKAVIDQKRFIERIVIENTYVLGKPTSFYNFEAFKLRAVQSIHNRANANKRQFIIAFTVSTAQVSTNTFHNATITNLNYLVSEYLHQILYVEKQKEGKNAIFSPKSVTFGFYRGTFLINLFLKDDKPIPSLIENISNFIYKTVDEQRLKIWAQPFFGIKETDKDDNITSSIEDAMIARNVSESNFESYTFFKQSFKKESANADIDEIESALNNNEFVVYYQAKYSVKEKRFISAEALARWNSPKYGLLTPSVFISKAENAGLISALDNYIFELALKDLSEALKRGRRVLPVSINFSLYEFYSHHFVDRVVSLLEKYRVPPTLIEIEITETTSQANQFLSVSVIKKLKDIGIRVLMDDFGVGYSGIDNLRNIPFDAIKIDKSFTDLITTDEKTRSIVKLLTDLGHMNDIEVIIEGVDNKEQVDILRRMKVDTIQGFYYSKPLSSTEYEQFLKNNVFEKER